MGVFETLSRALVPLRTKAATGTPATGYLPTLGSTPSAAGVLISQGSAMAVSTVHACVTIRSEDVARCKPRLRKKKEDGSFDIVEDHPVAQLFRKPNPLQTWFEFCEQIMAGYLLRSNAYAAIKRDSQGRPIALIPINPDAVMVLEGPRGGIYYQVNRVGFWQMSMLESFPLAIPVEDMWHLRGMSFNATVAASRIGLARDSIGVSMALEQQAARWMAAGASPSGVLQSKKALTEEAGKRLKASWNALFSGLQNVGQTAVLEDGLEWKPLSLSSVDLEFLAQRGFQVNDIARFFRVPVHKLAPTEGIKGLNIPQADQAYVNETIMPDLDRIEQKFDDVFDLQEQGLETNLDETELLRADIVTRYNSYRIGTLSGILSTNEARKSENLAPVKGGDEVRVPVNLAALGSDATGTAPDGAGRPGEGELPADSVPTK